MELYYAKENNFLFSDRTHWMLMLEHIPAAIAVFDNDMKYIAVTQRWIKDYQLEGEQILGRSHYDLFPDVPQRWKDIHQYCLQGNVQTCEEDPFVRDDGSTVWIKWEIHPWLKSQQRIGGIVMFTEVITHRKALQQLNIDLEQRVNERTIELSVARDKAEAASRAKSEFLSLMSHELRTPLNAILGFGQVLESDPANPLNGAQKESVEEIIRSGQHLFSLIEEILDLSAIESGDLTVENGVVDLLELVKESVAVVSERARESAIQIFDHVRQHAPINVSADALRLRQVLVNLLINAIKYNKPAGIVDIRCELIHDNKLRLKVNDTGLGIQAADLDDIFLPFEKVVFKNSVIDGSGIGLPLCKRLTEAMGGCMGVKSAPGKGSTFWLELDLVQSD
ncbi:MAG: ATP-binding protein [Gammaproteobacteria bacterium]|nr:ATP-binding protein [Gammaproteobacteria bacterium]MDH5653150.1 ATP-binding protein [Gammaproteobacteria bacterium]